MRVLSVEPKDICVTVEFSMTQIHHLINFLDRCSIEYSSEKEPRLNEAVAYVKDDLFKTLDRLSEQFSKEVM